MQEDLHLKALHAQYLVPRINFTKQQLTLHHTILRPILLKSLKLSQIRNLTINQHQDLLTFINIMAVIKEQQEGLKNLQNNQYRVHQRNKN